MNKTDIISEKIEIGSGAVAIFTFRKDDQGVYEYLEKFEEEYKRLRDFFQVTPPMIKISFLYSREEMAWHWGEEPPRWLSGMVDSEDPYQIYVYSPSVIEDETDESVEVIMPTLIHESAHAFVTIINKRCFYWINEGICQVLEGKEIDMSEVSEKDWQWFIDHEGLHNPELSWREQIEHEGYAIAHFLADRVLERFGREAVISLLQIPRVDDLNPAEKMEQVLNASPDTFLKECKRSFY